MPRVSNHLPNPFLTVADVAKLVQVSDRTVRRWIASDSLPAHRLGRQVRISRSDLRNFLSMHRQGGSGHDL